MPLDVRSEYLENTFPPLLLASLKVRSHDLDVLLRHRPLSIPPEVLLSMQSALFVQGGTFGVPPLARAFCFHAKGGNQLVAGAVLPLRMESGSR
jgi:hypothetical protein